MILVIFMMAGKKHEEKGSNLLKNFGFKYHKEVGRHGIDISDSDILSKETMLLIAADSCVDFECNISDFNFRRKDIENRYDKNDRQFYLDRFDRRITYLRKHGFNY